MSVSFIYMLIYSPVGGMLKLIIAALMLYGAWFILSKPSVPPKTQNIP